MSDASVLALDPHPDITFRAVGVALTQWELLEEQFAYLYSIFTRRPYRVDAIEEFGKDGRITRERIAKLKTVGEGFLFGKFNQAWDFTFRDDVIAPAVGLTARRHQIAHGVVTSIGTPSNPDPKPGEWSALNDKLVFGLCYPRYAHARLYQRGDPFMYGSAEILETAAKFAALRIVTEKFANELSAPPS